MGHETGSYEKIICCDRDDSNVAAVLAAALGRDHGSNDAAMFASLANQNNQWNNPFVYLVWMMMANRMGWGNNGCGEGYGCGYNNQMAAFQTQMQDNHNADLLVESVRGAEGATRELAATLNCDFNVLQNAICDVRAGIQKLSGEIGFSAERVINAVNLGNCSIIEQLKDCCCTTQKLILEQGYQNQIALQNQTNVLQRGQDMINRSIERGFSATAYQAQQDKCDIIRAGQDNTQRIIDTLNTHWKDEQAREIQDLKFQLSQKEQNELLLSKMRGFLGGCNNGCGCGNGCGF